jgi:antitoxin (DNA-binding transcriptional repressor) of toxin-antitoxin stability system
MSAFTKRGQMSVKQSVSAIAVQELEEHAREVLRRVREGGEIIDVTDEGVALARLVPVPPVDAATRQAITERRRQLIEDIGRVWPEGVSAADAIADVRREL